MMEGGALAWIKQHPYATAGVVFAVGIVLVLMLSGHSAPAAGNTSDAAALAEAQANEAASGNALQQLQAQLAASTNQTNAGVTANSQNDAVTQAIATLEATTTQNANQTTAQAAEATAGFNAAASETQSTAAVSVATANNNAGVTTNLYDQIVGVLSGNTAFRMAGGVISGNVNEGTGAFSIFGQPNEFDANGNPFTYVSPTGTVYGLQPAGTPPQQGSIAGNNGGIYAPVGQTPSATVLQANTPAQVA